MQNVDLNEKSEILYNIKNLFSYLKIDKEILMLGNIEIKKKEILPS